MAGQRRSPATVSGFHQGLSPRNKGLRYPPGPADGGGDHRRDARGRRSRRRSQAARRDRCAMAGCESAKRSRLWRAILTGHAAPCWCAVATGGKRREVEIDRWAFRAARDVAPGPRRAAGRRAFLRAPRPHPRPFAAPDPRFASNSRNTARVAADASSVRAANSPATPTRSRSSREGVPLVVTQHQLGHADLAITLRLPTRHRQHRDHPRHPQAARTNDPSSQRTPLLALTRSPGRDDRQTAPHTKPQRS